MNEHVAALVVGVIGNQEASSTARIRGVSLEIGLYLVLGFGAEVQTILLGIAPEDLADAGLLTLVHHLKKLSRLAPWRGAHVKDGHAGLVVDEQRGDHADDLLPADVSDARLGDEELLEGCERREFANNILRRGHPPGKLIGVPANGLRGLDRTIIEVFDGGDLGNVSDLKEALDGQGVTIVTVSQYICVSVGKEAGSERTLWSHRI